ncbi:hypothetical protein STXM2123_758 [Streptomyces sp. F-3]|nr:hypothetical protein STXM2123_758 [Streptomyces sp. F-3]
MAFGVLALTSAVIAAGWLFDRVSDRALEQAAGARWAEGVTPEWMSEQMGIDLPNAAQSPQAAYEVTSRFDTGLLTFTLTRAEAESYLEKHPPEGKWLEPRTHSEKVDVAPHYFAHFGLPEPETLKKDVRYGDVCSDAGKATENPGASDTPDSQYGMSDLYDMSDGRCVEMYVHEFSPQRTRFYIRAHFEPGISPLPATPSSSTD